MRMLRNRPKPANALGWLLIAALSAFALARELGRWVGAASDGPVWIAAVMGIFVLILAAIGVVRSALGRIGPAHRRWLGLPDRDWAFAGTFALLSGTALWWCGP